MTIVELSTFRGQASSSLAGTAIKSSPVSLLRPDCVAGHVGLELRNVVANYAFEKSRRFAGNQPNSGHGDHSRLSCSAGDTQLGPGGQHPAPSRTRWSKDDPPAANRTQARWNCGEAKTPKHNRSFGT